MNLENVKLNLETELVLNVGDPIGKTNAPRAYNKLFNVLGMNAIMLPVEIKKGELSKFLAACYTLGIHYFSPTMPHKSDIIPLLDDVDEVSRMFNSVNAVRIDENGVSHGVGMDGKGAVTALKDSDVELMGKSAVIMGSGSISGVIGYELIKSGVNQLTMLNRTPEKLNSISDILSEHTDAEIIPMLMTQSNLDQAAKDADIFIQCTPLGMAGYPYTHKYLGFIDHLPTHATVLDVIVNPPETPVIAAARKRGLKTVLGMSMLAGQMDVIFDFMFGVKLTKEHKSACIAELMEYLGLRGN